VIEADGRERMFSAVRVIKPQQTRTTKQWRAASRAARDGVNCLASGARPPAAPPAQMTSFCDALSDWRTGAHAADQRNQNGPLQVTKTRMRESVWRLKASVAPKLGSRM